jgi:hypothetical protein
MLYPCLSYYVRLSIICQLVKLMNKNKDPENIIIMYMKSTWEHLGRF